ncbi:glycosyltransferase [Yangia mangrovi]|uniref:Glycosyltransferase n=1 Tax=Alloyangia mangrovi TaxID=1779329 RepID=A0A2A3JZK1_9RHOB|nr:glycosyltransferase [Alloyangia mangrovi]MCT4372635.1 glycosyltransferase [Alloyangia mangrovi]
MLGHVAYLSVIVILGGAVTSDMLGRAGAPALVVGVLGMWRYSWAALNFLRAIYFRRVVHPRRKARAQARFADARHPVHAFFLVTSYGIDPEVTIQVYRSIFRAAARARDGATIVASVVEGADARLIRQVFEQAFGQVVGPEGGAGAGGSQGVRLIVDRIRGTGKRDAMARSLRIIARHCPSSRDIVVFVDGDSCVPETLVAEAAPWFTDQSVGALTTDEAVDIPRPGLFRDWFRLRFDQRQMMMCSMGLSNRVLTLTGRMSVFRADLATDPGFIEMVHADFIDHWRLGRVNFLTGDDKSTWFWLLRQGYEMIYLPDVRSVSAESQPRSGFLESASVLMVRWFGNMLRTNGRALKLSPWRIGLFTWWSILDQRVSIWTTLSGPILALTAALAFDMAVLPAYVAWVMLTRYVFCWGIAGFRGRLGFPISYAFLLYFNQLFGALVKSFVFFRLDRQKWTRQASAQGGGRAGLAERLVAAGSLHVHALTMGWLTVGLFWFAGLF